MYLLYCFGWKDLHFLIWSCRGGLYYNVILDEVQAMYVLNIEEQLLSVGIMSKLLSRSVICSWDLWLRTYSGRQNLVDIIISYILACHIAQYLPFVLTGDVRQLSRMELYVSSHCIPMLVIVSASTLLYQLPLVLTSNTSFGDPCTSLFPSPAPGLQYKITWPVHPTVPITTGNDIHYKFLWPVHHSFPTAANRRTGTRPSKIGRVPSQLPYSV
jgi:hypothetical protein